MGITLQKLQKKLIMRKNMRKCKIYQIMWVVAKNEEKT